MNAVLALEAISTVATRLAVSDMICDCKRLGWSASVLLLLVCMDLTSGQGRRGVVPPGVHHPPRGGCFSQGGQPVSKTCR